MQGYRLEMVEAQSSAKNRRERRHRRTMRPVPLIVAALASALALSAQGRTSGEQARADFEGELARQCPEKQLQLLSTRDLRDGLEDYMESLPAQIRERLQTAETDQCASADAAAACVNAADIGAVDDVGRIAELGGWICSSFNRCSEQGVCDYAR
jgi:hypothetical protein